MRRLRRLLAPVLGAFLLVAPVLPAVIALAASHPAQAQVTVSITIAPPPLPVYVQPPIPGPGWMWAPGYWAWSPYGYYWVPGTWVRPPRIGLLWTPGYWGWVTGVYVWHAGYWGPHVGFYGGVNYGFGYIGVGYVGGFWDHDRFHYNRAVNNIRNVHITNVYNQTIVNNVDITRNVNVTRVSYNGGQGGITARPTSQENAFAREPRVAATHVQAQHEQSARARPELRASANHGHPPIAATPRPAAFAARGAVRAEGAAVNHQPRPPAGHPRPQNAGRSAGPREPQPAVQGEQEHGGGPHGEERAPGGKPRGGDNEERHHP